MSAIEYVYDSVCLCVCVCVCVCMCGDALVLASETRSSLIFSGRHCETKDSHSCRHYQLSALPSAPCLFASFLFRRKLFL